MISQIKCKILRNFIYYIILIWLIQACSKESKNDKPEVFNYDCFTGTIAFSRSSGKIVILDGDRKKDTLLTVPGNAIIWNASVSLSPDVKNIAYSGLTGEGYQIFNLNLTSGDNQKLTKSGSGFVEHYTCPVWSADGQNIFYIRGGQIIPGPVFSIKPDGTELKQISDFPVYKRISVSRDKSFIVYSSTDQPQGIYSYNIQDKSKNQIKIYDSTFTAYSPVLSPDEMKIAFVLRHGFNEQGNPPFYYRIITINIDGTMEKIIADLPFERYVIDTYVTWSPDGTKLGLNYGGAINGDQGSHIFVINNDGTNMIQITFNSDYDDAPSWID